MDDRERSILRRSRSLFIRDLADVVTVCDRLYQREVLSEGMKNEILVSIWMIQSYMYIELEQDFKCRLVELFHYILKELLFEQNCKSTLLDF